MVAKTTPCLVLCLILLAANFTLQCVHEETLVPCLYVFGDSLSDSGNNNLLPTLAKCNYKPYGIDFPNGPTGRFTNGRNTIDFISAFLGFTDIPAYANIFIGLDVNIFKGVNYASGAAGIRKETGKHLRNLNLQPRTFCQPFTWILRRIQSIFSSQLKQLRT
ncbi:hypothetical protein VNO78_03981 [Psophocarpus tetragonolobus]|uniref:GDSL esterase/lipase n=1 Tax=Psophocarpus tetragonolobus TaxID=3891 RepID=A0AAN9XX68_PSOTE